MIKFIVIDGPNDPAVQNTPSNMLATTSHDGHDHDAPKGDISEPNLVVLIGLLTIAVAAIIGNLLVIVFSSSKSCLLHRSVSVFVVSLAAADLAIGALVIPFAALHAGFHGHWLLGKVMCYTWNACDVLGSTASIMHLSVISLERYLAVTRPLTFGRRRRRRHFIIVAVCIWIICAFLSSPLLIWFPPEGVEAGECYFTHSPVYLIASSLISFYVPFGVMAVVYVRIFCVIRAQLGSWRTGFLKVSGASGDSSGGLRVHYGGGATSWAAASAASAAMAASKNVPEQVRQPRPFSGVGKTAAALFKSRRTKSLAERPPLAKTESTTSPPPGGLENGSAGASSSDDVFMPSSGHSKVTKSISIAAATVPVNAKSISSLDSGLVAGPGLARIPSGREVSLSIDSLPGEEKNGGNGIAQRPYVQAKSDGVRNRRPSTTSSVQTVLMQGRRLFRSDRNSLTSTIPAFANSMGQSKALRSELKAVFTFATIFGAFTLCWLPFFVVNALNGVMLSLTGSDFVSEELYAMLSWLGYLNSALNPLIYAFTAFNRCGSGSGPGARAFQCCCGPSRPSISFNNTAAASAVSGLHMVNVASSQPTASTTRGSHISASRTPSARPPSMTLAPPNCSSQFLSSSKSQITVEPSVCLESLIEPPEGSVVLNSRMSTD